MDTIDNSRPYIVKITEVLTASECEELIKRIDQAGPEIATVNTAKGTRVKTDVRNNERVIVDDSVLSHMLMERIRSEAPEEIHGHVLVGANERLRCYRYKPGMKFAPHKDFAFVRNENEQSFYTFLVYLNDNFEGGATTFFTKPEVSIRPKCGMGLLFQHPFIHEGSVVTSGVKYVVRSDLMYRRAP